MLDKFLIDYIDFRVGKDSSVLFQKIVLEEEQDAVFMQVLYHGNSTLYKRYSKKLVVKDEQSAFNWDEKHANEYIIRNTYYVMLSDSDEPELLPTKKRAILNKLSLADKSLQNFIKREKINLRKDRDLVRLMIHYDAMVQSSKNPQTAQAAN